MTRTGVVNIAIRGAKMDTVTVIDTNKFSEETIWQAVALITRLANTPPTLTNLKELKRTARELQERIQQEGSLQCGPCSINAAP